MSDANFDRSTNQHGRHESDKHSNGVGFMFPLLLLIALVLVALAVGRRKVREAQGFARDVELSEIAQAIRSYEAKHGTKPPAIDRESVTRHLENVHGASSYPQGELSSLEETESLAFWLSGGHQKILSHKAESKSIFYEIDPARTRDHDNDGFPEYHDYSGNTFIIRNGEPMVLNSTGETVRSLDDVETETEPENAG